MGNYRKEEFFLGMKGNKAWKQLVWGDHKGLMFGNPEHEVR